MTDRVFREESFTRIPVQLKITGIQTGDLAAEPVVLMVRGEYFQKKGTHYIFYTEYGEFGEKTRNRLTFHFGQVELKKQGPGRSVLTFETGKRINCHYHTVAGLMSLVSDTKKIHWEESSSHRRLYMEYSLLMNDQIMSDYQLTVEMTMV